MMNYKTRILFSIIVLNFISCASLKYDLGLACKPVIGAGFVRSRNMEVDFILKNSPAEKIGIQIGDHLLNPDEYAGMSLGSEIEVRWEHEGKEHKAKTKLECVNELYSNW